MLEMSSKVTPKIKTPQLRMFERSSEIEVLYGVGAICNVIMILFNLERVYMSSDYFHIDIFWNCSDQYNCHVYKSRNNLCYAYVSDKNFSCIDLGLIFPAATCFS